MTNIDNKHKIIVDSHVHLYDCFILEQFLDAALINFRRVANESENKNSGYTFVMLLTETGGNNYFDKLLDDALNQNSVNQWQFITTEDSTAIIARKENQEEIVIIAGRQIITQEKLEVLALISNDKFADGLSLEETVKKILHQGGIPVLPWGFGKWIGKREKLLEDFLKNSDNDFIYLGDNGGRPSFWLQPPLFKLATSKGLKVLPGSDPLPLSFEFNRVGSFGFVLDKYLNLENPATHLQELLFNTQTVINTYGKLQNPVTFLENQIKLRLNKENPKINYQPPTINGFPETADIETSSDNYASRFTGKIGTWLLKVQEKATLKMLKTYPQATILDVGGGHGQLTKPLIDNGYQVTVLGSDESCQQRIQPYLKENLCSFQVGNVLDLPYPDNTFDVVISYRFLAHVTDWQKFLQELTRVAKKAVIIDYPTKRSFNAIAPYLFNLKKGVEKNTRPFICYQESELISFCKSQGLKPAQRYAQFTVPMVLHRMGKNPTISSMAESLLRSFGITYFFGSPIILKLVFK